MSDVWLNAIVEVRERTPKGERTEAVRTAVVDLRSAGSLGLPFSAAAVQFEAESGVWLRGRVELVAVAWCLSHDWWGYAVSVAKARKWAARPELWCVKCGNPGGVVNGWFLGDVGDATRREVPGWSFVGELPGDDVEGRGELLTLIGTSRFAVSSSLGANGRRRALSTPGMQFRPSMDQVRTMSRLISSRVEAEAPEQDAVEIVALEIGPHELERFGGLVRARAAARMAARQLGLRVATLEVKAIDGRGVYVLVSRVIDGTRLTAEGTAELARTGRLPEETASKYYRLKYAHATEHFRADRPAVVYLVTSQALRAHKVGIMNAGKSRLEDHEVWGWQVVSTLECPTGEMARAVERRVLRHLHDVRRLGAAVSAEMMPQGGYTETVDAGAITADEIWDEVLAAAQGVMRREALVRGQAGAMAWDTSSPRRTARRGQSSP
ncbi:hypothetical protein [Nonomuraea ceibae]|uniref:hypothetical protein n=1 Tax=Nonomuraea ceibae TaxID=1935170 RepID=UPI001C5F81C8|nr:hypothetical protein [Nonomuraea ceibae]